MINNIFDTTIETKFETSLLPEKKKRGRKPKNKTLIEPINNEPKIIKKRGRKTTNNKLINLVTETNIDMVSNLIVHLPLKYNDINKIINTNKEFMNDVKETKKEVKQKEELVLSQYVDFTDDRLQLHNTNYHSCNCCSSYVEKINKLEEEINNLKNGIILSSSNFNKKIYESKVNFINKLLNKYEDKTDIACWWCCHTFNNIPLGIPEYINKNEFNLIGCFCSFNCMMAYNIDINDYKIWDRQSNIYQMKNKIDPENKTTIHPAPPRQTLEMFGGPLDINKYRESFFIVNKEYRYFFPPMISLIGLIEEDNVNLTNYSNTNKQNNQTMLRRNKPLSNKNNRLVDIIKTN